MPSHALSIILQNCFHLTVGDVIVNICVTRMKMSEKRKQFRAENCKCKAQKLKEKKNMRPLFEVPKKTKFGDEPNHRAGVHKHFKQWANSQSPRLVG